MGFGFDRIVQSIFPGRKGLSTGSTRPPWMKFVRKGGLIGAVAVAAGSLLGGYTHWFGQAGDKPVAPIEAPKPALQPAKPGTPVTVSAAARREPLRPGTRYVRRNNSVLRAAAKNGAKALARKPKGAAVTVLSVSADGWAEVQDGGLHGYMRASVLGEPPAPAK